MLNPLMGRGTYSATSNNMKLVHWQLMSGLYQIDGQCTNRRIDPLICGFNVPVKGLKAKALRCWLWLHHRSYNRTDGRQTLTVEL